MLDYWDPVPIQDHFIRGRFEEATEEVKRQFAHLRNTFCETSFNFVKVHKCMREAGCLCAQYANLLVLLAHYTRV